MTDDNSDKEVEENRYKVEVESKELENCLCHFYRIVSFFSTKSSMKR